MKTYLFTALILGMTVMSCSKEKTEANANNDSMSTVENPSDTSMALPPTDTSAMNAPSSVKIDSANVKRDSAESSIRK